MPTTNPHHRRTLAALTALGAACASSSAHAQRSHPAASVVEPALAPPPVALELTARPDTLRWAFALHNTSSQPVDVPLDRRLLWLEVQPPAAVPEPGPRARRARPLRASRCTAMDHPSTTEPSPRVQLAAGERRGEGFDVRDLCGLRLPRAFVPGATLTLHYGYRTTRGGPTFGHAVVFDGHTPATTDLAAEPTSVPGSAEAWPPAPPPADLGDGRVRVLVSGSLNGPTLGSIRVAARLRQAGPYPMHTFFRPDQLRIEATDPYGHRVECGIGPRGYTPVREFFASLTDRRGPSATVLLGEVCDPARVTRSGTYRAQVVYSNDTDGAEFGFHTFLGRSASPYFFFRVTRGREAGRYEPLAVDDPFGPPHAPGDAPGHTP